MVGIWALTSYPTGTALPFAIGGATRMPLLSADQSEGRFATANPGVGTLGVPAIAGGAPITQATTRQEIGRVVRIRRVTHALWTYRESTYGSWTCDVA